MKHLPTIAGLLLGLPFVALGSMVLLGLGPTPPPPPEGSPSAHFFAAFATTGYLTFVKVCEVIGGLLVAVPRTRNLGLLVLGPILLNILVFHLCVAQDGTGGPIVLGLSGLALYLVWAERNAFAGLVTRPKRSGG